jgi:Peptidase family M28
MESILKYTLLAVLGFAASTLAAQNALPILSNISLTADTANHQVTVSYDLNDAENDPMEVWIQVSADSGRTWRVAIDAVTGDQGYPIVSGSGKSLVWHYLPSTLSAYGAGLATYQLRLIADDRQTVDLQQVADLVDSARLHQEMLGLEGVRQRAAGLQKLEDTKDSLEVFMDQYQLHPYRQGEAFGNYVCENVIGRRSGTRRDSACWQISGHFDTVYNSPGGDDNATAVACVSEAIRVLSNFQTKESLRFFYFDLEEAGLIGSTQYIVNGGVPDWEEPKGLLNMDCVGSYSNAPNSQVMPAGFNILFPAAYAAVQADSFRGNFLTSIVNTASSWLDTVFVSTAAAHVPALKINTLVTPGTGLLTLDLRRSDHAAFWDAGIPAIFFSDGANFRNLNYHTPNDSVKGVNMPFYVNNVRAIVTTLARLAQLEHSTVALAGGFDVAVPVGIAQPKAVVAQPKITIVPNPSDGRVTFKMELPLAGNARLEVRDHHGRMLYVVQDGWKDAGLHTIKWQGALGSGQYAVVLITESGYAYHPLLIQR